MPATDTSPELGGDGGARSGDAAGTDVTTSPTNLRRLLPALAEEPTLAAQVGRRDAVVAVPTLGASVRHRGHGRGLGATAAGRLHIDQRRG